MADDPAAFTRRRIAEAIGGRDRAKAFEEAHGEPFKRKTLQSWIDGQTSPPLDKLMALAEAVNRHPSYFLPPSPGAAAFEAIPLLNATASAGPGHPDETLYGVERLDFPLWMLERIGVAGRRLACLHAKGDSMAPVIADGALMLVDMTAKTLPEDNPLIQAQADIYVLISNDERNVKHLRRRDSAVLVFGEQRDDVELLRGSGVAALEIFGRVVWWDNRL